MRRAIIGFVFTSVVVAGCAVDTGENASQTGQEALSSSASYYLTVDQINILNTRAWIDDTDVAVTGAAAGGAMAPATTHYIGNVDNGVHNVNLPSSVVTTSGTGNVTFSFIITNSGYDASDAATADKVLDGISSVAQGIATALYPIAGLWQAVNAAVQEINGIFTANCDGIVATDMISYDSATLASLTASGSYGEWRTYNGTNSAIGCGSNSKYLVHWTIHQQSATQAVERFQGQNGLASPLASDWQYGSFKAQCAPGQAVKGLSLSTTSSWSHDALCRTGTTAAAAFPQTSCHARNFASGDSRGTTSVGDWAPGFYKGECASNEYVAGVAQTTSGQVDAILCCPGPETHTACTAETIVSSDARETTDTGDWDYGYYKAECGDDRYAAGISRGTTTGKPRSVLCCGF